MLITLRELWITQSNIIRLVEGLRDNVNPNVDKCSKNVDNCYSLKRHQRCIA